MLAQTAVEGKLAIRADAAKHQGDFRKIVGGFNDTLDAVIGPLNVAAEYVDRISKGDIPPTITDAYNGDFNEIENNLNQCIETLNALIAETHHMADEHKRGAIDVFIPAEKFTGAYRTMAEGPTSAYRPTLITFWRFSISSRPTLKATLPRSWQNSPGIAGDFNE